MTTAHKPKPSHYQPYSCSIDHKPLHNTNSENLRHTVTYLWQLWHVCLLPYTLPTDCMDSAVDNTCVHAYIHTHIHKYTRSGLCAPRHTHTFVSAIQFVSVWLVQAHPIKSLWHATMSGDDNIMSLLLQFCDHEQSTLLTTLVSIHDHFPHLQPWRWFL